MEQKKKKEYTGFPGDLHEDHIVALNQFRDIVKQQFLYEEGSGKVGQSQTIFDDAYLLRFLRARKFDVKKTQIMWDNFISWRQKNEVDKVVKEYKFIELNQVKQFYPHSYLMQDKLGRPVYIERIGQLKLQQLFEITSEERLIKYYTQTYEILLQRIFPSCSLQAGKRIDQTLTILDLKGSQMKMMSKSVYNFIQIATKIAQDNYPEILGKMFIINAPMLFTGIWQVIKPWLDEKTRNKITIIGGKYYSKLCEFIDEENIPDFLGGKYITEGNDNFGKNIGVWNPNGEKPLYPGEEGYDENLYGSCQDLEVLNSNNNNQQNNQQQFLDGEDEDEDDEEEKDQNLDQLKNALLDMGLGAQNVQKAPHNPNKYEQTQGPGMVSDTPLNTQMEEADGDYDNMY